MINEWNILSRKEEGTVRNIDQFAIENFHNTRYVNMKPEFLYRKYTFIV